QEAVLRRLVALGVAPEALLVGEHPPQGLDPAERVELLRPVGTHPFAVAVERGEDAVHVEGVVIQRGHRAGGEVQPGRLGAQGIGEQRAGTLALEAEAVHQPVLLRYSARSATCAATSPLSRPSSNSNVGWAFSSGKSWGFSTSSGPMRGTASRARRSTFA